MINQTIILEEKDYVTQNRSHPLLITKMAPKLLTATMGMIFMYFLEIQPLKAGRVEGGGGHSHASKQKPHIKFMKYDTNKLCSLRNHTLFKINYV